MAVNLWRLSVMAQYHRQVIPIIEVPSSSYRPAPKVDSAVVRPIPYKGKTLSGDRYCYEPYHITSL